MKSYPYFNNKNKKSEKDINLNISSLLFSISIVLASTIIFTTLTNNISNAGAEDYVFSSKWGSQGNNDGQFEEPTGIAIDSSDNVFVSDMDFQDCCNALHHTLQNFTNDGTFVSKLGGNGAFVNPMGIDFDSSGNIYVVDQVHQRIVKYTSSGTFITSWGSGFNPTDIAIDSSDNVYVTEMYDSRVAKFTSTGALIERWNTGPISRGIAVDSSDNIWVTSANIGVINYLVQKFTSDGTLLTSWNSAGNDGVNIPTYNGYGLAFDSQGKLIIADTFNNRIQKYHTNGTLITQFGTAGTGDGQFDSPHYLAVDSSDKIFVSDTHNHRVQVFTQNSPPVADDMEIKVKKGKPAAITLSANDPDGDPITYSIETNPSHGTISGFNPSTGTLTYTPDKKYLGDDQFTFKVTDSNTAESNIATVLIHVSNKISAFDTVSSILDSFGKK